jgi:hypothetical protein
MIKLRLRKQKSGFQQRLEKIQLQMKNEETGDSGPDKVSLHDKDNPLPWTSILDELPPYYIPVDIYVNGDVHEDWHRVSNGEIDYYCNSRDDKITTFVTHWRKRQGVNYNPYEPLTTHDILILSTNDVHVLIEDIKGELQPGDQGQMKYNLAILRIVGLIKRTLKEKTRTALGRAESSIPRSNTQI